MAIAIQRRMPAATRRDLILDAAEVAFGRHGYHSATTREVAALATVSEALLYQHFAGKRELFEAVAARAMNRLEELFEEAWTSRQPFRMGMSAYFDFVDAHPDLHRVFFRQALQADPGVEGLYDGFIRRLAERFQAEVVVVEGIIGMANQLALWWADGRPVPKPEIVERAARMAEAVYNSEVEHGPERTNR
jgi:AcrR family transcriptional regulator